MMLSIELNGSMLNFDAFSPIDISMPLRFNGPQANAYGVDSATAQPCQAGEIVGDTRLGGSVNFEQYSLIPHCNGTHTECVGHITDERISVRDCLRDVMVPAFLVTLEPENGVLVRSSLEKVIEAVTYGLDPNTRVLEASSPALIVRTLPNDDSKLTRSYGVGNIPPYFTADSMEYIVQCGFKHLLVDLPSIDRIFDEGKLINHRIFWNVEVGSRETHTATRIYSTITELIYVPNEVADGVYLLNLQIAPFATDAAPSRPMLLKQL